MKHKYVSVYSLGYVGLTLCAAWLRAGYKVLGVDIVEEKVKAFKWRPDQPYRSYG